MSKQKPKQAKAVTATTPKAKADKPPVLYLRITPAHETALEAYITRQKAKPDRQAVGVAALELFLQQEGLWPPDETK